MLPHTLSEKGGCFCVPRSETNAQTTPLCPLPLSFFINYVFIRRVIIMRCVLQISYRLARLTFLLRLLFLPQFGAFHAFATLQTAPVSIPNIFFALFTSCFITFCLLNPSLIYLITRLLIILVLLIE